MGVKVSATVSERTKKELVALSIFFNKTVSDIVREAIEDYLTKYKFLVCPTCSRPVTRVYHKSMKYYAYCEFCEKTTPVEWMR